VEFSYYAEVAVQLVNADLESPGALREHLTRYPWLSERLRPTDLKALRRFQTELAAVVDASTRGADTDVVARLNDLLSRHTIRPRISGHDATTWHLHVNDDDASVAEALTAEALFGLTLLVTELGATRLGRCAAPDCQRAFVDNTTNCSRRFCSTQCATRTNVAKYRQRHQGSMTPQHREDRATPRLGRSRPGLDHL
jgi:predicted RNA-binding Zn ribbon-like protein